MTPEDRRLVAALTTETLELRAALVKLAAEYTRVCGMFGLKPLKHTPYRDAMEMLK